MTAKTWNGEGGSNGSALTTSDTGSGDAVNGVEASSEPTYSTSAAWHGSLGLAAVNSATSRFQWTGFAGASANMVCRFYYKVASPTASTQIAQMRTSVGQACGIVHNSTGVFNFVNSAGTGSGNSTSLTSRAGTWIRVEMQVVSGASTAGSIAYQLFDGDSTSAFDSNTFTGLNTRGGNLTQFFVGNINAANYGASILFDDLAATDGTTTPLGGTTVPKSLTDTGTGTDAVTVATTVPIADTGAGTDAVTVAAAVPLTQTATGTDAVTVAATTSVADNAAGTDAVTVASPASVADTGTGTDAFGASATVPIADTATAADSLTASVTASPMTETATSDEGFTVTVTTTLDDTGTTVEGLTGGTVAPPRDLTITVTTGHDRWSIQPGGDRWTPTTGHDRWASTTSKETP